MKYIILITLLFILEQIYFRIADKFNIIDKPNERSSHSEVTLRGGGILYWVVALLYLLADFSEFSLIFFICVTVVALISFIDDIKEVGQGKRLLFHLTAMSLIFYALNIFLFPWWIVAIGYIFFIGIINAYNFMDGINGITGLYSLSVLGVLQYVNIYIQKFVNIDFIWFPILASVVFLFFNFRKKAKCFAGDIGSIVIAFWVVTLLLLLMIKTNSLIWIGFLAVYGVDVVLTILHRLYLRQNIFDAHRLHFYQVLANEKKIQHRIVAVIYFVIQSVCSALIVIYQAKVGWEVLVTILVILSITYLYKFKILKNIQHAHY